MVKLDLEQAFRHIPVRPEDWHLLGFTWEEKFYYDIVFGFGLRSAPYIFNLFAEALHWILDRHLPARIRHYLDDFLKIFSPNIPQDVVQHALEWAMALGTQLGLRFQPSKIEGPATCLEFLGIELDSRSMEARLPQAKLDYLMELLSNWQCHTHCILRELQELTGFLQFASQVIPTSRAFIRALFDFSATFPSPYSRRRIPSLAHRDIDWWSQFARSWNGTHFISPHHETVHIYTDASGSKGIGGIFGTHWFSARTPRRYRHRHIQVKEMFAAVHAVLCWGEDLAHKHVVFHVDNEAVAKAMTSLSIRSAPTMEILRQFLSLASRLDFTFESSWLSSAENSLADAASRFAYSRLFTLAPYLDKKPSLKCLRLGGTNVTITGPKPSRSIFGMDSHQAHDLPTIPANPVSSSMPIYMASTTPTAPFSQHLKLPSCLGSPVSLATFNQKPSSPILPMSDPCTQTWTSHSQHAKHPLSSGSFGESSVTMVKKIANQSNPLRSPSCSPSCNTLNQAHPPIQHAALHTPHYSAVANLPPEAAQNSILQFTSHGTLSNSSLHSKIQPTSLLLSHLPKPTPSGKGSQSPSQPCLVNHPVLSPLSNTCLKPYHAVERHHSSKDLMATFSIEASSSPPSGRHSSQLATTPAPSLAIVSAVVEHHPQLQPVSPTMKSNYLVVGAAMHTNFTLKSTTPDSCNSHPSYTGSIHHPPLTNLRFFKAPPLWLESAPCLE